MTIKNAKRRDFLGKAGTATLGAGAVAAASTFPAPYVKAQGPIRWRLQTYAGPALAEFVIKPSIDEFNRVANGEMEIELFYADQLVPTPELFRAMQAGTIDAVQSDDDSIAAPVDVSVFGGYFPFASRYSLDVPTLFNHWGLKEIWQEAYDEIEGVTWLSAGSWDPCNFVTRDPIRSIADLQGKRVFTFPTAGRFLTQFGVVPVTLPWEDIEVALQTGELDGVAWCGITEAYTVGWADVTNYYLTNNISGAWVGSYFANTERWNELPDHLQGLFNALHGQLPLLPPALVLVGRSLLPRHRRQARAHHHPRSRMGRGRSRSRGLLRRNRRGIGKKCQDRRDHQELPRRHGQGRAALPVWVSARGRMWGG